jgi:hypothetical protein
MDEYAVPISISADTTAAGSVFRRVAQVGYAMPICGRDDLSAFIAVEEPTTSDYTLLAAGDERIQRYPNLIGRMHWVNSRDWRYNSSLHIAGLLRGMGREDVAFVEDFDAGWGFSAMAKFRPMQSRENTYYVGAVFGEGIGNYIFGFSQDSPSTPGENMPAAVPVGGKLEAQVNYGVHAGYCRNWSDYSATSFGYGYAYAESTPDMPANAARMLQNAWVNHQVKLNELLAVGLEYHYAVRDVRNRVTGDTHRVLFVVQFLTK